MTEGDHAYDIAVSFAGAQRPYVERVVRKCEALGLRVFYDRNKTLDLWGRNIILELRKVYGGIAVRYVIPFLSRAYLAGSYPMDEFRAATRVAIERPDGYLLPVLMEDDVVVPPELVDPAIGHLRAKDFSPEDLANAIADKIGVGQGPHRDSPDTRRAAAQQENADRGSGVPSRIGSRTRSTPPRPRTSCRRASSTSSTSTSTSSRFRPSRPPDPTDRPSAPGRNWKSGSGRF